MIWVVRLKALALRRLFFDKHSEETWYVSASAGAVSENFEEWYEDWLEKSPLKIDKSALSSIDTVKFYAY